MIPGSNKNNNFLRGAVHCTEVTGTTGLTRNRCGGLMRSGMAVHGIQEGNVHRSFRHDGIFRWKRNTQLACLAGCSCVYAMMIRSNVTVLLPQVPMCHRIHNCNSKLLVHLFNVARTSRLTARGNHTDMSQVEVCHKNGISDN